MTADPDDTPTTDLQEPSGTPAVDPGSPLFDDEGDIDADRQDAPRAEKLGDDKEELDGFRATPGDRDEDR
jgi:hypothetical protein